MLTIVLSSMRTATAGIGARVVGGELSFPMGINVLSLFDGMACGLVALKRAGIQVDNYFASEIDSYAMKIAKKNHPEIVHLGDVQKWQEWNLPKIDLLIGGSPCQGFSNAGKGRNFDDPRSRLFYTYVEIRDELHRRNPELQFLLENVKMKQEWQDIINDEMGVFPVKINSALVSAQNRERLYWANWKIEQPEDRGIYLKDVVLSDAYTPPVVLHNVYGGFSEKENRIFVDKSPTLRTAAGGGHIPSFLKACAFRNQQTKRGVESQLNIRRDDKSNCVVPTYSQKLNCYVDIDELIHSPEALEYMNRLTSDGRTHWDFSHHSDVRSEKSAAIVANFFKGVPYNVMKDWDCIRKFHPIECERLQTLPDGYSEGVSNTQRYKMIGNGWTVDVIAYILKSNPKLIHDTVL